VIFRTDQAPTIYQIEFSTRDWSDQPREATPNNNTPSTAYEIPNIGSLGLVSGLSLHNAADQDWFRFVLAEDGVQLEGREIGADGVGKLRRHDRIRLIRKTPGSVTLQLLDPANLDATGNPLAVLDRAGRPISATADRASAATISLGGVTKNVPGGAYLLRVTGEAVARYELEPVIGPEPGTAVLDLSDPLNAACITCRVETFLGSTQQILRRDVVLGGEGNDILQGGSAEEWIFGGPGNDVLTGGFDRQAGDLIWGGTGDDTFQVLPDGLPFIKTTERYVNQADRKTYLPTLTDRFDGQAGDDRVLFPRRRP